MLNNQTHLCETVNPNQKNFAQELKDLDVEKGTVVFYKPQNGKKMLAYKFRALKDKSNNKPEVVSMLSTVHNVETVYTGKNNKQSLSQLLQMTTTIIWVK